MNTEKGIFFLFVIIIFLKNAYLYSIPNFIYTIWENVFLKVFDLEGMGYILVVDTGLKE